MPSQVIRVAGLAIALIASVGLSTESAQAQADPKGTPFVCTSETEQACRDRTVTCINRSCGGSGSEESADGQQCRTQCFVGLRKCLTQYGCK